MEAQEMSNQENDSLAGQVMNSVGMQDGSENEVEQSHDAGETANSNEGTDHAKQLSSAKKRLKAQSMAHERDMREMHARIADMQARMPNSSQDQAASPYGNQVQPGSVDEQIHKAVSFALNHRDMEERKAKDAQNQQHVQKQYKELYKHLDNMGDKYDDFHDVVMGDDAQFTPAMRDYSMTLPKKGSGSAGEVLYNLGKNPSELERIAKLHPLDQAAEMSRLSHALISGGESKDSQPRPLGQIKSNPVINSRSVTDKTSVGDLRQRMKSGSFK